MFNWSQKLVLDLSIIIFVIKSLLINLFSAETFTFLADDIDKDEDNEENKSRCPKKNSMLNASNTIGACNYLTKTREKKVSTTINNPSNISKPRKIKSFVRKNNFQHESQAPVIIVSNNHTEESTEKLSANALKENVIKALTAEKSRPGRRERKRRRSCGDMDHIRAKWLLGFNLTMVTELSHRKL